MAAPAGEIAARYRPRRRTEHVGARGLAVVSMVAVVLLGGCTKELEYTVDGVVIDAETGKPLEGAMVHLEFRNPYPKLPHDWAAPTAHPTFPLTTDDEGRFTVRLRKDRRTVERGGAQWDLVFQRPGYIREKVSISPDRKLLPLKVPARMRIFVMLRPGDDRPGNRRRRVPLLPAPPIRF